VLDSEPKPVSRNVDIQIPSPDSGDFKPKASSPIRVAPEAAVAKAPEATAKPEAPADPAASGKGAAAPTGKEPVKTEPAAASAPPVETAAKEFSKASSGEAVRTETGGYAVQVAALADAAKAKQLEKRMAGVGLKTYTQVVSTKAGEVTRVRAGPYETREAAEKARTQLKKVGLDGKVVSK
jgi:DedD protein